MEISKLTYNELEWSLKNLTINDINEMINLATATRTLASQYYFNVKKSILNDRDVLGIKYKGKVLCFGGVLLDGIIWMLTTNEAHSLNKINKLQLFKKLREYLKNCFENSTSEYFFNVIHKDNHEHIKFVKTLGGKFEKAPDGFEDFLMFKIYRSDYV